MTLSQRSILFIEEGYDNPLGLTQNHIEGLHYQYAIVRAHSLNQANSLIIQRRFDCVIIGDTLPKTVILETIVHLTENLNAPSASVLLLIDKKNASLVSEAVQKGTQGYLIRENLTLEAVRIAVESAIEKVELLHRLHVKSLLLHMQQPADNLFTGGETEPEKKSTQAGIDYTDAWFRALAALSPVGIFRTDIEGNCLYVNSQWSQMSGMDFAGARGKGWREAIHVKDRAQVDAAWKNAMEHKSTIHAEYRFLHHDGKTVWVLGQAVAERDEEGNQSGFIGTITDITTQKKATEELHESKAFLQRLIDSNPDCVKILDLQGRLIWMSETGMCLMEIDDFAPLRDRLWCSLWPADMNNVVNDAVESANRGEITTFYGNSPTAIGTTKSWEVVVSPIYDSKGNVERILAVSRDITERRRSELKLRESELLLRTLTDSLPEFIWTSASDGTVLYVNQRWTDYSGLTMEQTRDGIRYSAIHPKDIPLLNANWTVALQTGSSFEAEFRCRNYRTGEYRWFLCRGIPVKENDKV